VNTDGGDRGINFGRLPFGHNEFEEDAGNR
jgi:hypothetical protein